MCGANGYPDPSDAYLTAARDGTLLTAGSSAPCGGTVTAAPSRSPSSSTKRRELTVGPLRCTTVKIMQDGVAENFTAAMTRPLPATAAAAPPTTRGHQLRRAGRARASTSPRWTPWTSRCTSTPSATGRCARRSTPSRPPAPPTASATPARTSPTCRWCTPTTCPASAGSGRPPTSRPLWAAHEPQMDELTLPFLGARAAGVAVPVRRPAPRRGDHRGRQRLAGQQPGSAARRARRGQPGAPGPRRRAVPARAAARPGERARRLHGGLGLREPPRRHRHARAPATGPTWSCSTATRSTPRPTEIGEARVSATYVGGVLVYAR